MLLVCYYTGMKQVLSSRQMINIELAARATNQSNAQLIQKHMPAAEQAGLKILFNCECSDPNCDERISLTIEEFDKLHRIESQFVIVKGHDEPSVESIKATSEKLAVVDKYAL